MLAQLHRDVLLLPRHARIPQEVRHRSGEGGGTVDRAGYGSPLCQVLDAAAGATIAYGAMLKHEEHFDDLVALLLREPGMYDVQLLQQFLPKVRKREKELGKMPTSSLNGASLNCTGKPCDNLGGAARRCRSRRRARL